MLARLLEQIGTPDGFLLRNVQVYSSEVKEHANVWALRMWRGEADELDDDERCIFLNDDVEVCPSLCSVVRAACGYANIVSLHSQLTATTYLAELGERHVSSYWLSGPGYVMTGRAVRGVLDWCENAAPSVMQFLNEDGWAALYAWRERIPILHTVPALVKHDTSTASTLGYDNHMFRSAAITWDDPMFYGHDLTKTGFWNRWPDRPVFIACPWMPEAALRFWSAGRELNGLCALCCVTQGTFGPKQGGPSLCYDCLLSAVQACNDIAKPRTT